jgi:hypothetical protein
MSTETVLVRCWHFYCPECGFGDTEMDQLAHGHEIYCEVCLSESGLHVRVHRWPMETEATEGGWSTEGPQRSSPQEAA